MTLRLSNKPSQSILWPSNHGRLILFLESVDEVLHRVVMARGIPTNVGIANSGKQCIVILGHKEVQNHQIYLLPADVIFSSVADSKGRLSSIGLDNLGKDVTVILRLSKQEEADKGIEKENQLKKLKDEIAKKQEQINRLAERINELEKE